MAMKKKAPKRPSLGRVLILGVLTLTLGALLSIASLSSQPVSEVRAMPAEDKVQPGMVYYIKGSEASSLNWRAARNQLERQAAGTVRLTEADLNAWAKMAFERRAAARPAPGAEGEAPKEPGLLGLKVNVTGVNFRIDGDQLQIGAYVELPDLMPGRRFTYQVRGTLEAKSGGGLDFSPREGTLGRAPIARIPIVGGLFHHTLVGLVESAPEMVALSDKVGAIKAAKIVDQQVELTLE